ncbi:MAG: diguanylate cyclase [Clostridia bacterium]|nr:diguanylate cyclase [Clostridia bacterium]
MHSIRTKIILLTVITIVITMAAATVLSVYTIRNLGNDSSEQILSLLCQNGEKNLNAYFDSVSQSAKTVSSYANDDLKHTDLEQLGEHLTRVEALFEKTASNTNGILTYYYRIDPSVSDVDKGFWYVKSGNREFKSHEVTDINKYDTTDQDKLVWFSVPKTTGRSIWLPPYFTENLGAYVYSYNVPIYKGKTFIGVIGIEIDYYTIAEVVNNISLYDNGYAFINDEKGNIIYHPHMKISELTSGKKIMVPEGLISSSSIVSYTYEGVKKQAVWSELNNGMRLNISVPVSEISKDWRNLIMEIVLILGVLLIVFVLVTWRLSKRITNPLRKLTEGALQVDAGNYDVNLDYKGQDEVGILTNTFNLLINHMKAYINDLNNLVYSDALTAVRNKGAFDVYMRELQNRIDNKDENLRFAIGIFDCDNLKKINDEYGHQNGNNYLKAASALICTVFHYSPVFRVGGDEFAVILFEHDYKRREELACIFEKKSFEIRDSATEAWEKVSVSLGIADYEPGTDKYVGDVVKRADDLMYQNKNNRKALN